MQGQMMTQPLLISSLIEHAARHHGDTEITSVETGGGLTRTNWSGVAGSAKRLASVLDNMGLKQGSRCATIAWNNHRHMEIYFGVSGGGYVCHTINPRLFPEQLVYIINHAEDEVLFIDETFLPIAIGLADKLPTLKHVVLMGPGNEDAAAKLPGLKFYDDLIAEGDAGFEWPALDEGAASSLCYTSGTTGNPKGVLYSHRSTLLHSMAISLPDSIGFSAMDVILPVVPMFHVNAWGAPYAGAMVGARMVMPGPGLDGSSLVKLIDKETVTVALGVPTIWQGLLNAASDSGSTLDSLKRNVVGGSACPPSMIAEFRDKYSVETVHAWGMTEMSPLGTANQPLRKHLDLDAEAMAKLRENQGRPPFGVELKLTDNNGAPLPTDGDAQGDLLVRGHWIVEEYFRAEEGSPLVDGWFPTGDVATIDADGFMTIKDRSKDIIKSGGEWISSVELENIAISHPELADAAVIAVPHPKWDERPLLVAVKAGDASPTVEEVLSYFDDKIAAWQKPDSVVFVTELPRNATGKVLKNKLREEFGAG